MWKGPKVGFDCAYVYVVFCICLSRFRMCVCTILVRGLAEELTERLRPTALYKVESTASYLSTGVDTQHVRNVVLYCGYGISVCMSILDV